jgi:hypothetical protein
LNEELEILGYLIVAIFIGSWLLSMLIYRLRGYDRIDVEDRDEKAAAEAAKEIRDAGYEIGHHGLVPLPTEDVGAVGVALEARLDRVEQGDDAGDEQERDDGGHQGVLDRGDAALSPGGPVHLHPQLQRESQADGGDQAPLHA